MKIKQVDYSIRSKEKFEVFYDNKEYTCYLDCYNGNYVCTGNGESIDCEDITDTKLGMSIILACFNYKREIERRSKCS